MLRIALTSLLGEAILAQSIVSPQGTLIVREGTPLTPPLVEKLRTKNITHVIIQEPGTETIQVVEPLSTRTYWLLRDLARDLLQALGREKGLPNGISALQKAIPAALEETLQAPPFVLYPLAGDQEDLFAIRAVNTACLAVYTGKSLFPQGELHSLALSAFLQDLGLFRLPPSLLEKALQEGHALEEDPGFQPHVNFSLGLIQKHLLISAHAKKIVAQHHERWDGSGYPLGTAGEEIHPLSRWMAIVDSYLSQILRVGKAVLPHEGLEWLFAGAGFLYDPEMVMTFRDRVPLYPPGLEVKLSSGEIGIIAGPGAHPSRPRVIVIRDPQGGPLKPREVDLSSELQLMIVEVR
ncbi:MAG: HD domain-containing phosphohydrolase [Bacillota bacterium]|nr:HD domain-containing phosphohydrolase [Bacillota bacterium]